MRAQNRLEAASGEVSHYFPDISDRLGP